MENTSSLPYRISLYFCAGPYMGRTYTSQDIYIPIGSMQGKNKLVIPDDSIQPEHAYIVQDQGRVYIHLQDPTFYLAVNKKPVLGIDLQNGDTITLGTIDITCQLQPVSPVAVTSEEPEQKGYQPVQRAAPSAYQGQQQSSMVMPAASQNQSTSGNSRVAQSSDEVTRYLCAAVYSDEAFRDYVLEHIFGEEMKAPGEAYGVDIVPVVRWALAARSRTLIRDILLLIAAPIISVLLFHVSQSFSNLFQLLPPELALLLAGLFSLGTSGLLTSLLYIVLFLLILVLLIVRPFTSAKNRRWLLMAVISFILVPLIVYFPILSVAWVIVIGERLWCYFGPQAQLLTRKRFRSDSGGTLLDPGMEQWLRSRFPQKDGNLVVYSGYSPFAGSGVNTHGWSFVVDVSKGKDKGNTTPQPFEVKDLYIAQATAIENLGLKNLSIEDKLYANGKELRNQQERYQGEFLPHPFAAPATIVSQEMVENFKEHPTEDVRYYQCIKITSWKKDLILSVFIRFYLSGRNSATNNNAKNLFLEGNYQLLTPIKERYREIDRLATSFNLRRGWLVVKRTFIPATFKLLLGPPIRLSRAILKNWLQETKRQQIRNEITDNPSFDYGTITSLRELVSSEKYQRYFQRLDEEMYVKLIEYQLFEAIIAFLEEHNIDTGQLRARQETIINNGLMVSGGTFNASAMTFGESSTITTNTTENNSSTGSTQSTAS